MRYCLKTTLLCISIVFLLQACGAAPRPFRALTVDDKYSNPLLLQRDGAGIHIYVAEGMSPERAQSLEVALIDAFAFAHIPATTGAELVNGHQLLGRRYLDGDMEAFRWTLSSKYGEKIGEGIGLAVAGLSDREIVKILASQVSDEISALLKPENMQALQVAGLTASVAIVSVKGAPGDGDEVLPKALQLMLQEANISTVSDPALAILHVFGNVELINEEDGGEKIRIDWVFKYPTGEELGRIAQENNIQPGSLTHKWRDSAYDVAYAMVETISEALKLVKNKNAGFTN